MPESHMQSDSSGSNTEFNINAITTMDDRVVAPPNIDYYLSFGENQLKSLMFTAFEQNQLIDEEVKLEKGEVTFQEYSSSKFTTNQSGGAIAFRPHFTIANQMINLEEEVQ